MLFHGAPCEMIFTGVQRKISHQVKILCYLIFSLFFHIPILATVHAGQKDVCNVWREHIFRLMHWIHKWKFWMKVNETPNLKLEIKIRKKYYCTYSNHWRIQGGRQGCPCDLHPNSFIFMQFSAHNLQNNRLAHILWKLVPHSGKSWISHCHFYYDPNYARLHNPNKIALHLENAGIGNPDFSKTELF